MIKTQILISSAYQQAGIIFSSISKIISRVTASKWMMLLSLITCLLLIGSIQTQAQQHKKRPGSKYKKTWKKHAIKKKNTIHKKVDKFEEDEEYDGPDKAVALEFNKTKDPATGRVPRERMLVAIKAAEQSKDQRNSRPLAPLGVYTWTERGPTSDLVGPTNGNTRANSGVASGRIRAVCVDQADATGKTVWIGGVNGGLWKSTDITLSPANWVLVNDFLSNLAVTYICQDPSNVNTLYFCTGEAYFNADAVSGNGVFKSTDHGVTWNQLPSTATYFYCTRIVCDNSGNVYLGTRGSGLLRSINGGASWTNITPTGMVNRIGDLALSSTGRLHVVSGIFNTQIYRYTDVPATVTSGAGWTAPATAFPSYSMRAEIACSGNVLYACPADASYQVPTIYKSTDGGANWAATGGQPTAGWASGQGWYALAMGINPADPNQCIAGGLDTWKTTDGGATWIKISNWVGTTGQYVHADIHDIVWYDNGNKLLFACDGGMHFSADNGVTIRDRNVGLRIKQFYSCAIHPTTTDYFLAGAQDNGSHQFTITGLGSTTEVTGGDGAFVQIDQDQPQYQFTSYVYNQYRRSTNSGGSWTSVNLSGTTGQFINPIDYDNTANIMYCANSAGTYRRWTNPQTGNTNASVTITALNNQEVTAVTVSPYTANRLYLGTWNGTGGTRICYVDGANTIATGSPGTNISTGLPTNVYTACIATGTNDNNLMVCFSNYGVQNIWVSSNGGTSWTAIDGNLPDMPVRWCMFNPCGNNTKAIIATEAGIWNTDLINGASTVWTAETTFPTVRTDMIKYRSADGTLAAATHGRGLFTTVIAPCNNIFSGTGNWTTNARWSYGFPPLTADNATIAANANATLNTDVTVAGKLTMSATSTLVVNSINTLSIANTGVVDFAGQSVTFKSDNTGTASLGQVLGTLNGATNVTVERYLPMNLGSGSRRWRLLTAPFKTTSAPTINAGWQAGSSNSIRTSPVDPRPGYGTQITRSTAWAADGYDIGSTNNPSIYYYSGGSWLVPANTNSVKLTDNGGCYMLFARGDRSLVVSGTSVAAAPTTFDPKGQLNTGNITVPLVASGYQTVGNPYASQIKLDNINFNDTLGNKKTIYLWDPKTSGSSNVGKFIVCSGDGGSPATYTYTGNTSAYSGGVIESSGAFMVKGNGGNIIFHETDKTAGSSTIGIASRPVNAQGIFGPISKLYTDLMVMRDSVMEIADGVANTYNRYYKNDIDAFDVPKLISFSTREVISLRRRDQLLAVERRKNLSARDTIFLDISKLNQADYQFNFRPVDFNDTYTPFLVDKFLNTAIPFSLTQNAAVPFRITADTASATADRFHIIFKRSRRLRDISLKADMNFNEIYLQWENPDTQADKTHFIERSEDGIHFSTIAPVKDSIRKNDYQWMDKNPSAGCYDYRIRFINADGNTMYSNIVNVQVPAPKNVPGIVVMPNPVLNGKINVQMGQLPLGRYSVKVINNLGTVVYSGTINHQNRSATEVIEVKNKSSKGIYRLELIAPSGIKHVQKLFIN